MKRLFYRFISFIIAAGILFTVQACSSRQTVTPGSVTTSLGGGATAGSPAVTGAAAGVPAGAAGSAGSTGYWPDKAWRETTPEEQGMDPGLLLNMLQFLQEGQHPVHSIVIIRNGCKVLDANFFPNRSDVLHVVNSCTKSVTSAAFGMAKGQGLIKSTGEKVLDSFPGLKIRNMDQNKKDLELVHLLTMTAGFEWSENGSYDSNDSWVNMQGSDDPIQYILDKPVTEKPGTRFYYNTGASHLLSAVVQKVTGQKAADYVRKKLFDPIGIKDFFWNEDRKGHSTGGAGLFLSPLDMARFGYLYLRGGQWDGKQIVPADWVRESTEKKVETPSGLAGRYGYGYQWWMNSFGGYSARGYGGQYIFVVPEYDIVAVFTASLAGYDFFLPENVMGSFVIPSVKGAGPIQGDSDAGSRLKEKLKELQQPPRAEAVKKLPQLAESISGKVIKADNGEEFCLTFNNGEDGAAAGFRHGPSNDMKVGLDNVYRVSEAGRYWPLPDGNLTAAKGEWTDDKTFTINVLSLNEMDTLTYTFAFEGSDVKIDLYSQQGGNIMEAKGRLS